MLEEFHYDNLTIPQCRRAKGGDKDSQRAVNEEIVRHRALLAKADAAAEGAGTAAAEEDNEEMDVSKT